MRTFKNLLSIVLPLAGILLANPLAGQEPRWTSLGPFGGQVNSLTADPSRPGVVYAAGFSVGVFRSADAGSSWTALFAGEVSSNVAVDPAAPSVLYVVASPGVVWKSVDAGAHWSPSSRGLPADLGLFHFLAVDPARPNRVYLGSSRGVWRSVNGGVSWQSANAGFPTAPTLPAVTALAAVRRPVGTAFAGTVAGLFRTTNGGASWQRLGQGLPPGIAGTAVFALAVSSSDPQTFYVLFEGGRLYRSRNGGSSWQPAAGLPANPPVTSLVADPRSSATLYASLLGGQVLRSTDGAARWTAAGRLPGAVQTVVLAPDPFTRRRLYAGLTQAAIPGGIFRSDNGGATWQRRSEGLAALAASALAVDPSDPDQLWTGQNSFLFRSANRGRRWSRLAAPGGFLLPVPGEMGVGAASAVFVRTFQLLPIGRSTLFRTENNGASWTPVFGPLERFQSFLQYRIAPSDPETLYALADVELLQPGDSLLRSADSGDSWQTRATGLLLGSCGLGQLVVAPSSADVLYATGAASLPPLFCAGPSSQVLRSRDGGATWTDVSAGLPARGFVARAAVDPGDPDTVYVGFETDSFSSTGGVWKSTDGGATWEQAGGELAGRSITSLLATAVPGRIYAALAGGRGFRSDDGGEHWEDATGRLVTRFIYELVADPSDPDRIYAATWNGVWVLEED